MLSYTNDIFGEALPLVLISVCVFALFLIVLGIYLHSRRK